MPMEWEAWDLHINGIEEVQFLKLMNISSELRKVSQPNQSTSRITNGKVTASYIIDGAGNENNNKLQNTLLILFCFCSIVTGTCYCRNRKISTNIRHSSFPRRDQTLGLQDCPLQLPSSGRIFNDCS